MSTTPKPMGRPYSTLTPELAEQLVAEYRLARYNASARAKQLGISRSALYYHLRGGKVARALSGAKREGSK